MVRVPDEHLDGSGIWVGMKFSTPSSDLTVFAVSDAQLQYGVLP